MEFRILITGIGRRVELVQAFRQAALQLGCTLKLYGADMAGTAPALAYCDHTRRVCAMKQPDYIPQLLEICRQDQIDLVIPTIDTDLIVLSQHAAEFEAIGTRVLISSPEVIAVCRDKNYTADFFESCGLKAPRTVNDHLKYTGEYPCFIKPKDGSSSINAFKVKEPEELAVYAEKIGDYVIQPFIEGTEYTVDIFCDFDGNPIYVTPRERVAVRSGEVLKTRITMDPTIIEESLQLIARFRPCGPITVQLIRQRESNQDYYIEINPRYGGGAPLSMKAGADSAAAVLRLLAGEIIPYQAMAAADGAVYSRFDQSVCIDEGGSHLPVRGVIFDLDDTLYSEKDYIRSGYQAVAAYLGSDAYKERLWDHFTAGRPAIDALLSELDRLEEKAACLEIYRSHMPDITLYSDAAALINELKMHGIPIGIITDGRPEGQRNKLKALGLDKLVDDIIITDELGGIQFRKPCDIAYRILQCRWRIPFGQLVYIGDNASKDFQAPRQLGMQQLHVLNPDGLYYDQAIEDQRSLSEIKTCILS